MSAVRKARWPLAAGLAIVAGFLAFGAPVPVPAAEGPQVFMVDNEPDLTRWNYDPATVTVPPGGTVVWLNKGKEDHSVTADDRSFDSGLKKSGATFSRVFPRSGTYTYHCQPHPWMKGLVEVRAAAAPTPTSAVATSPSSTTAPTTAAPGATAPAETPGSTTPAASENPASAPDAPAGEAGEQKKSDDNAAAPASDNDKGSGGHLARNLALVLLPTLGALALGAKLRRSRS